MEENKIAADIIKLNQNNDLKIPTENKNNSSVFSFAPEILLFTNRNKAPSKIEIKIKRIN